MSDDEVYLTIQEVSTITGISVSTLRSYKQQGVGPPYCELSPKMFRYRKNDVHKWMTEHLKESNDQ